ncbi:hypothetical protein EGW08_019020 [Elysia chlorotica]|uniref:Uncharacterized protein n=1 Tax=Elysia chlorotica TaxID=188477 RepID=A0A433SVE9_ELYCH|nr:hypothetical protein EGW08_019020 [Elysia chlorotica]
MRHRASRTREMAASSSTSLHQQQQQQQQQQHQQQQHQQQQAHNSAVSVAKVEEYAVESSVTVKVTPESPSPSPSLSTPVHFSAPTAVKDAPTTFAGQRSPSGGGEPAASPATAGEESGDLQQEEEGFTAQASEMVTPESPSPSPSLSTPVHFSAPTAVKDAPTTFAGQRSPSGGGEPAASPATAGEESGDLQQEEEGFTAQASEMLGEPDSSRVGTGATSTSVDPLPGSWLAARMADLTPDLQVFLS